MSYFYKLKHIATGRVYVGIQYGRTSHTVNILKTYFTTSKYVRNIIKKEGVDSFIIDKIIIFDSGEECRNYETRYLRRAYKWLGRSKFLSLLFNRNLAPGPVFPEELRAATNLKISKAHLGKPGTMLGKHHSDATKLKLSITRRDWYIYNKHPKGMLGKHHSEETKQKQSDNSSRLFLGIKGADHPASKMKWFNNGVEDKRCIDSPGSEWIPGRVFKKRIRKEK